MFEPSNEEREYLLSLLKTAHTGMLHELHHSDHLEFKEQLKREIEMNERLTSRLQVVLAGVR